MGANGQALRGDRSGPLTRASDSRFSGPPVPSTSLQRTYRNLRLAIAGTVVLIGVAVAVTATRVGILDSISAYYYTPARDVLVGALVAASFAILALSGRGLQRALLDAAALFAPLIALVPTMRVPGLTPGAAGCTRDGVCVPPGIVADIETGVWTYLVFGSLAVIVVIVVCIVRATREGPAVAWALVPSIVIAVVVLGIVLLSWLLARDAFIACAHLIAAVVFFGLIAAVAVANVFEPPHPDARPPTPALRLAYWLIAGVLVADLLAIIVVVGGGLDAGLSPSPLFAGEAVALGLFVVFWVLQSAQRWNDRDPRLAAGP
jgi:hypothetical protein